MCTVIVIGVDHTNTLGVIRSLGEAGFSSIFINETIPDKYNSFVHSSKYIKQYYEVNSANDGINLILEYFGSSTNTKHVIIPTTDTSAMAIDQRYDELSKYFIVGSVNHDQGKLTKYMDKEEIRIFANSIGFTVPKSWILNCAERIDIPNDVEYPCIIKAIKSALGRKDVKIYDNVSDLKEGLNDLSKDCPLIQIQQYIKKDFEILVNGCRLKSGKTILSCVLKKIRHYPYGFGHYSYGYVSPDIGKYINPALLSELITRLNYYGLFSIEFIVANGVPYFLEVNLRNDGTSYISTYGGVNLPAIWVRDSLDLPNPHNDRVNNAFYTSLAVRDIHYVLSNKIPLFKWVREMSSVKVDLLWNKKDLKPTFRYILNTIKRNL